jgi:Uma2 family endonuclease
VALRANPHGPDAPGHDGEAGQARRLERTPEWNDAMSKVAAAYEPVIRMSRKEYRAWAEQQDIGRYERVNGEVAAMAPKRISHARVKARVWQALDRAIRIAGIPCEALPDGITVEVGDSDYQPDAIVQCGPLDPNGTTADSPCILVEVLSPATSNVERAWKLQEYFRLPSLHHYLIVWADKPQIAHHWRADDSGIETRTVTSGEIVLDPPGITISVAEIYA